MYDGYVKQYFVPSGGKLSVVDVCRCKWRIKQSCMLGKPQRRGRLCAPVGRDHGEWDISYCVSGVVGCCSGHLYVADAHLHQWLAQRELYLSELFGEPACPDRNSLCFAEHYQHGAVLHTYLVLDQCYVVRFGGRLLDRECAVRKCVGGSAFGYFGISSVLYRPWRHDCSSGVGDCDGR